MGDFTIEQREWLQDALIHRAALLSCEIADCLPESRLSNSASLALRNEEEDPRELDAPDDVEAEIDYARVEQVMRQLREVTETLARLRSPDYGLCTQCEGEIPFRDLKSDPTLTICPLCQQWRDPEHGQ
ncbi:MAG: hypothetical protein A3G27_04470 [Betaproteobacteria bacterium RIFCSPLOWO2_12_FULL_66_14]|nr:MAG: hypothetical protein A3G27_04470 [Betaproteobacteria bacterium RIFCSPLOWO2_12_FULL_66_14]